ncbi:MAG: hypothetical protein GWP12_02605 [Nitrospirae bacterium]|nr:hypothetical protein [Nitrospirota bacterium]
MIEMCHTSVELKKWGNSLGIIIPKEKVDELGLSEHDLIDALIIAQKNRFGCKVISGDPYFELIENTIFLSN